MKFKKIHILLIMSLLLLVSIGSVCASEVSADADIQTSTDGSVDVLEDGTDGDTTQEQINTTIHTDKDTYKIDKNSDKNISMDVQDNESKPIENINKTDLRVSENKTNLYFTYTNSILTITSDLSVGNHTLLIEYLGNNTYNYTSKSILLQVFREKQLEIADTTVITGDNIEIPVKVFDGVDYLPVTKDDFGDLTLTYINETGNKTNKTISDFTVTDGKIQFTVENIKLISASLTVNYTNGTSINKTTLLKYNTTIDTTYAERIKDSEDKNITVTIKSGEELTITENDLQVLENGEIVKFKYNSSIITITQLGLGEHNLTIIYKGNETYLSSNKTITLKIYGNNTINVPESVVINDNNIEIPITISNGLENITLDAGKFTLNLTYINATGNLTSKTVQGTIEDGKLKINDIGDIKLINANLIIDYENSTGKKTVKIYLNTTVNAKDIKLHENTDKNITVTIKNGDETLTITKNDLQVLENGKPIEFTYNNSIITIKSLKIGVHNLTIIYNGNNTYAQSSKNITVKVWGNQTINPSESANIDSDKNVEIVLNLSDGADQVEINKDNLTITLFYKKGDGNYTKTFEPSEITIDNQTIKLQIDESFDSAYAEIEYQAETKLTGKTVIKVDSEVIASDLQKGESEVKNFTVEIKGSNGEKINITSSNLKIFDSAGKEVKFTYNGSVITLNDTYTFGVYNLTIKYLGNDTYAESVKNITLTVYGINATSSVKVNSTKKGEVTIKIINGAENVTVTTDDLILNITYEQDNKTIEIPITNWRIENGTIYFELENGNFTKAILNIKYNNTETNVTLNRIYNVKLEVINNEAEYQTGNFTYKVIDIDNEAESLENKTIKLTYKITSTVISFGGSSVTISNSINAVINSNNEAIFNNNQIIQYLGEAIVLPIGENNVTISGDQFNVVNSTQTVIIDLATIKIVIDPYSEYYGSDVKVKITVTNANTGDSVKYTILHLYMPQTTAKDYYIQTNENGTSEISVSSLVSGEYDLTVSNNDTKNINQKEVSGKITIKRIPISISTKDVTILYNTGTTNTVKFVNKLTNKALANAYVVLKIDSTTMYGITNSNGVLTITASLNVGKHKMTVMNVYMIDSNNYIRDVYQYSQVSKTITVNKASGKISAPKVTAYYKQGKYFTVKLTNTKNKKAIYNAKVNIKIYVSKNRYYNYNGNTGANGQLKLLIDLKPGTYKVEVSGADSKNYAAKKVTSKITVKKAPTKLIPKKLTSKKGKKNYFKVTVKNTKTKKVIKGIKIKIKVYTGKKSKTYTVKTNSKGIAQINVKSLKVGKHKVVVTSANKYCVAKTAKSTITIKK